MRARPDSPRSCQIVGWLVLAALLSTPANAEAIDLIAESDVYFSRNDTTDHVTATLRGPSCAEAVFTMTVRSDGTEVFRREIPMETLIPCDWVRAHPEQARWSMANTVNRAVAPLRAVNRNCLGLHRVGCWQSEKLERLRRQDVAVLCFNTNWESSACVAYDPESKTVIEVWSYSE